MNEHPEIPYGHYCYKIEGMEYGEKTEKSAEIAKLFGGEDKGEVTLRTEICPHWGADPNYPEHENGFCTLTGQKDWIDETLLWDQVKECGINNQELPEAND